MYEDLIEHEVMDLADFEELVEEGYDESQAWEMTLLS